MERALEICEVIGQGFDSIASTKLRNSKCNANSLQVSPGVSNAHSPVKMPKKSSYIVSASPNAHIPTTEVKGGSTPATIVNLVNKTATSIIS